MTLINVLLLINTVLLICILIKVNELLKKKRYDELVEEQIYETEKEKAMIELYGNIENLVMENPDYVLSRHVEKLEALGLDKERISSWINSFKEAPIDKKKEMAEGSFKIKITPHKEE